MASIFSCRNCLFLIFWYYYLLFNSYSIILLCYYLFFCNFFSMDLRRFSFYLFIFSVFICFSFSYYYFISISSLVTICWCLLSLYSLALIIWAIYDWCYYFDSTLGGRYSSLNSGLIGCFFYAFILKLRLVWSYRYFSFCSIYDLFSFNSIAFFYYIFIFLFKNSSSRTYGS